MWWIMGAVIGILLIIAAITIAAKPVCPKAVQLKTGTDAAAGISNEAGRSCDACGGPLRVLFEGRPWVYYHCSSCSKDFCNPCAARAGRGTQRYSAACPLCKKDLRDSRM